MYVYVRCCITITHATEPKATIPTGNRSASIERSLGRGPWRIPGEPLEGPCISQCCVFHRFERILRNLWRVPRESPAKCCWKGPQRCLMQTLFSCSNHRWDKRFSTWGRCSDTCNIWIYIYIYIYTYIYIYIYILMCIFIDMSVQMLPEWCVFVLHVYPKLSS